MQFIIDKVLSQSYIKMNELKKYLPNYKQFLSFVKMKYI